METKGSFAAVIMAKNEEMSILSTLNSLVDKVDVLVFWDTGSTDKTLDIVEEWKRRNGSIDVFVGIGEFVDFSQARNDSLRFAESFKEISFVIILDAGDEIVSTITRDQLKSVIASHECVVYNIQKKWKHGSDFTTYMIPLIIRLHQGCKYLYPSA